MYDTWSIDAVNRYDLRNHEELDDLHLQGHLPTDDEVGTPKPVDSGVTEHAGLACRAGS